MLCPSVYGTMMNQQCVLHAEWSIESGGSGLVVRRGSSNYKTASTAHYTPSCL